jgi:myo-inositol-1(or 4)-monophosphatase
VREKNPADLVTEADLEAQAAVTRVILEAFPDHGILGEEGAEHLGKPGAPRWIVDPLDGTTNYVHGYPHFAVSIGCEWDGQVQVGCIFDPTLNECYTAARGKGARRNGEPIRVSPTVELKAALVGASFGPLPLADAPEIAQFISVLGVCRSVRRQGSAALSLAYVACGRLDAYWALENKAWDVAAGIVLVEEAGGVLTRLDGGPVDLMRPKLVTSATPQLHSELRQMLLKAGQTSG